jgi:hypothetical protein
MAQSKLFLNRLFKLLELIDHGLKIPGFIEDQKPTGRENKGFQAEQDFK